MSSSWGIGFLQVVQRAESADEAFASLGKVLERGHDGGAEMAPIGGLIKLRGDGASLGAGRDGGEFAARPPGGAIRSRESYHLGLERNSGVGVGWGLMSME